MSLTGLVGLIVGSQGFDDANPLRHNNRYVCFFCRPRGTSFQICSDDGVRLEVEALQLRRRKLICGCHGTRDSVHKLIGHLLGA